MSAVGTLLVQRLRRDRVTVSIWIASTGFLAVVSSVGVAREYASQADREAIMQLALANPAILLLRGLPQGAGLDQFIFFEIFTYLALMAGLMSTFLAVRHSRAEEESGRAELVASTPAGRTTPTMATVIHGVIANLVLGLLVAAAFIATGLDAVGSLLTGAASAATGIAFLGVALLVGQFVRSSRAANGISVALVLAAFAARGVGDALGAPAADGLHMTSAWPSWLSPIGWAQHVDAFGTNNPLPLLLGVALAAIAIAAVLLLESRRDTGASILPTRSGRMDAAPHLSGVLGLAWRLQWPSVLGWAIGGAACGLLAGSLSSLVRSAAESSPAVGNSLTAMASSGVSLDQALITVMFSIVGVLAAACAVQAVVRVRQEEAAGTAELVLSGAVSRVRWFASYLLVGLAAIIVVLACAAVLAAVSVAATGSPFSLARDAGESAVAQLPAALVVLGVIAVIFTVLPRLTVGLGWSLLGAAAFLGIFGSLIGLPEEVSRLSPFANTPVPFAADVDYTGAAVMLGLAIVAVAASLMLMRRRELAQG